MVNFKEIVSNKRVVGLVLGQIFSLLITSTGFSSSKLARRGLYFHYLGSMPISGASMNPARSLGPAIVKWRFKGIWAYIFGPIIGTVTGGFVYKLWIVHFTRQFKNHVGLHTNPYLDLHEIGMELYSEAMEDDILNKNAPNLFNIAGEKFKETSGYHQRVQRVCEFLFLVGCVYIFSTVSVITMGRGIVGKSVLVP
ncbi:putative major intrinsic protein [Helianthus anomalus]